MLGAPEILKIIPRAKPEKFKINTGICPRKIAQKILSPLKIEKRGKCKNRSTTILSFFQKSRTVRNTKRHSPMAEDFCPSGSRCFDEYLDCSRVQFGRSVTDDDIKAARDAGLIRNLFYSDEPEDAGRYTARGIDVVLTNAANILTAGTGLR